MLSPLTILLAILSSIFRSRAALDLENLALRHRVGVLQRSARKRLKFTPMDRLSERLHVARQQEVEGLEWRIRSDPSACRFAASFT